MTNSRVEASENVFVEAIPSRFRSPDVERQVAGGKGEDTALYDLRARCEVIHHRLRNVQFREVLRILDADDDRVEPGAVEELDGAAVAMSSIA
ncbi:hypothetical protein ACFFQF_29875 [Haladaptatus pallidirubidus]|uniref:hypothetical protein n=1 Tax=Haladaptatus pallidirubidus TaxID=1008152 RepID=UPI001D11A1E1|nr:hypothetical protein [Haladaptatus pallidirubidus]